MNQTKNYGLKKPEVSEFFKLADWNENFDKIDSEIKSKEDKIEEIANTEFTVADKRENIASKEKMPKILGKIAKWFSDLKTVAFSGSYNDLSDKPIVDANISSTSTNPVQNKVVKNALDHKLNGYTVTYIVPANTGGWHKIAQISDYFNFDLYAGGGWFSASKSIAHFQIQNIHGKIRIVQLSGKVLPNANNGIAKIRMVRVSDDVDTWILEEYSPSSINPEGYTFTMAGSLKLTPLDGSVDSTTSFKDSVSLDVIDITTGYVITTGAVDNTMSDTSEHPVQNKVIKAYVDKKASENVDFSTSTSKLLNDSIEAPMLVTNATKNLLKPTLGTTTKNGVTCTNNGDGTYTLNGTSTIDGYTFFDLGFYMTGIEAYGLTLIGDKNSDYGHNSYGIYWDASAGSTNVSSGWVEGKSTKIPEITNGANVNVGFFIAIGGKRTANNVVFKPMLTTDLSATYDDFVPYNGYEIKSCGKNLLKPALATTTANGITCTNNGDGTYTFNGTATMGTFFNINTKIPIIKGNKYKFVCFKSGIATNNLYSAIKHLGNASSNYLTNEGIFTAEEDGCWCWVFVNDGATANNVTIYPMITRDLTATVSDYEPYQESTVQITPSTEFPLLGLKSFDGETNIISPGNVEVTYAKSDSGAAIVDTLKKSVSDGKTKVANAITDKGVETATDATFDVMAENISKIDTEAHGATLAVSTSDHELFGKTVTLDMHHTIVGTTVFSNNGTCSFIVQRSGPYTITCGEAHKDVSVTNIDVLNKTTISVNLLLLKIVTFASGTDEEIAKMIQAHYNNKINIADYWAVGDTRSVSLSAMSSAMVGESHRAQTVQFVIADFEHDTLASGIGPHSKAAITLLQKDCLMDAANASNPVNGRHNTENGYMRGSSTNVGGWDSCARRGWCNDTYFKALPATWRSMVKEVIKYTGKGGAALSGTQSTSDKIFLPSPIELSGSTDGGVDGEGTQYQYYKNARANRYKMPKWDASNSRYLSSVYMTRSPKASNTYEYCYVWADGTLIPQGPANNAGIAPMLCI